MGSRLALTMLTPNNYTNGLRHIRTVAPKQDNDEVCIATQLNLHIADLSSNYALVTVHASERTASVTVTVRGSTEKSPIRTRHLLLWPKLPIPHAPSRR